MSSVGARSFDQEFFNSRRADFNSHELLAAFSRKVLLILSKPSISSEALNSSGNPSVMNSKVSPGERGYSCNL